MARARYAIKFNALSQKWEISRGPVFVSAHDTQEAAQTEAQRLVEDDAWHAANR